MVKRTLKWLWYSIAALIISVAVLVSVARLLFPQVEQLKPEFEHYLSVRTGAKVRIGSVYGAWRGFGPELRVENIELLAPDSDEPLLTVGRFEAALDLPRSLLTLHAVMRRFEVDGLKTLVELDKNGALVLPGLAIDSGVDSGISARYVIDSLLRQNRVAITNTEIRYRRRQGDVIPLVLSEVSLNNRRGQHQAIGALTVHEGGAARFVLEFSDYPLTASDQMAFYLESQSLDLARLPLSTSALGVHLEDGDLQLQFWSNWRDGGWRDGQASLTLTRLQVLNEAQQRKQIASIGGRLHFARAEDEIWYLHGEHVRWQSNGETSPELTIEGVVRKDDGIQHWGIDVGALSLADVLAVAQFSSAVPAAAREQLTALSLSANLPRVQVDFQLRDDELLDWAFASQFDHLRYQSESLPVIADVRGRVLLHPNGGGARLLATDQAIDFHDVFRQPIAVTAFDLGLRWRTQDDGISLTIPQLRVHNDDATVSARATVLLPHEGEPELALAATIDNAVGANKSRYLPVAVMSPELVAYLDDAIIAATVEHGQAVVRGPLPAFPFAQHNGVFDVRAEVSSAQYRFQPDWPVVEDIRAALQFTGNSMFIDLDQARLHRMQVQKGAVVLDPMGGPAATLNVQALGRGDGVDAVALLNASPLRDSLLPVTDTLAVDGALTAELELAIPLHDSDHSRVNGTIRFDEATVQLKPLTLPLTAARGQVAFAEYGITGGNVSAETLGGTLQAELSGDRGGGRIRFDGDASSAAVAAWYPHPMQQKLSGAFRYTGQVLLPGEQQQGVQVELGSDLTGVVVQAPAPFGKSAEQAVAFQFVAGIERERLSLYGNYRDQLVFQAEQHGDERMRAELLLGGSSYAGHAPGLSIRGNVDFIDAAEWIPFVADLVTATDELSSAAGPAQTQADASSEALSQAPSLALSIAQADFHGLPIQHLDVGGHDAGSGYQLELRAPTLVGDVLLAAGKPIQIALEKFLHEAPEQNTNATAVSANVPDAPLVAITDGAITDSAITDSAITDSTIADRTTSDRASADGTAADPLGALAAEPVVSLSTPADWPELDVDCKQCRFYGRDLGQLLISVRNQEADKKLNVRAKRNGLLEASFDGLWSATLQQTRVTGRVSSRDWGKLTTDWGVDLSIRQSSGHADVDLRWPGSPADFRLRDSRGELRLQLGKGHIARGSDGAERVLRVFSLLSLQSITRRLSLDFSDLFREGFYYDEIRGKFLIADGKASTSDTVIDGVSASINFSGETDFVNRTLNQQIEVTPKLSSSLPILAGWVINPPAGIVVWLMNKLFIEPAVKVVTGLQYSVRGPWDNPEVIERGRTEKEVPVPAEGLPEPGSVVPTDPVPATPTAVTPTAVTPIAATPTAASPAHVPAPRQEDKP